jgi:hypothetical protein
MGTGVFWSNTGNGDSCLGDFWDGGGIPRVEAVTYSVMGVQMEETESGFVPLSLFRRAAKKEIKMFTKSYTFSCESLAECDVTGRGTGT